MDIQQYINEINSGTSKKDIEHICKNICETQGYEYFILGLTVPSSIETSSSVIIDSYPVKWLARYISEAYYEIDPVILHCSERTTPILWRDVPEMTRHRYKSGAVVMEEACAFGLKDGITVPIHGLRGEKGVFTLATSQEQIDPRVVLQTLTVMQNLVPYLYEALVRLREEEEQKSVMLTLREKECLMWACAGKSSWEISQILGVSERTVIFHLGNVTAKTGSVNRQHAIAKSLVTGLVQVQMRL